MQFWGIKRNINIWTKVVIHNKPNELLNEQSKKDKCSYWYNKTTRKRIFHNIFESLCQTQTYPQYVLAGLCDQNCGIQSVNRHRHAHKSKNRGTYDLLKWYLLPSDCDHWRPIKIYDQNSTTNVHVYKVNPVSVILTRLKIGGLIF